MGADASVTIEDNYVYANTGDGINFYFGFLTADFGDHSIAGNHIGVAPMGVNVPSPGTSGHCINLREKVTNVNIYNNDLEYCGLDGIAVNAAAGSNITVDEFNQFRGIGGIPIDLADNGTSPNDSNDIDSGPNGLLNSPMRLTMFSANGIKRANLIYDGNPADAALSYKFVLFKKSGDGYVRQGVASSVLDAQGDAGFNMTLSGSTLAVGDSMVAFVISHAGDTSEFSKEFQVLPQVREVGVFSSDPEGLLDGFYTVPAGSGEQLRTVPIGAADTFRITFSVDVNINAAHVKLIPNRGAGTPYPVASFEYDPALTRATVRFDDDANPSTAFIMQDRVVLRVEDNVTNAQGTARLLDGNWQNPSNLTESSQRFPSGDDAAGGDFDFRLTFLPGDADRDNTIGVGDLNAVRNNFGMTSAQFVHGDSNADGVVNIEDLNYVRNNFGLNFSSWTASLTMLAGLSNGSQQPPIGEAAMRAALLVYFDENESERDDLISLLHPATESPSSTFPATGASTWFLLGDVDWWDSLFDELVAT